MSLKCACVLFHKYMRTFRSFIITSALTLIFSAAVSAQTLTSLDGASVDPSNQKGKVVVLAVGASWLPLSAKQADYANALAKKYSGKNVAFYFVATDSTNPKSKNFATADDIRKFVATNKLSMTVLLDPDGSATRHKYDIDQFPSFVIIDKTGTQAGESIGGVDSTGKYDLTVPLSRAIDKLL
jgi:thiol-disulfide isomerase/thioredoxin